jgi:Ca2+-binding EF-hand superfamily protein
MHDVFYNLLERIRLNDKIKTQLRMNKEQLRVIFKVIDTDLNGYIDHYKVKQLKAFFDFFFS